MADGHGSQHGHHMISTESQPEKARATRGTRAWFAAKCLCGCGDTRSQVGGATSRLGSVVPGAVVARLAEAAIVIPEDRVLLLWRDVRFEVDPIPI